MWVAAEALEEIPPVLRRLADQVRAAQPREQEEYNKLNRRFKAMDTINKRLEGETGGKESYLMAFSPKGDGRAAIATGNPDTADNVVTSVPGTGADLDGIGGKLDRSDNILHKAGRLSKEDTAAVTWVGYDAPDGLSEAKWSDSAEDAAGDLQSFQDGLRATHEGPASNNTLIGHSYGTTAIGEAAQTFQSDPGPTRIPGLGSTETHSKYWNADSESLKSISRIATGKEPG